MAVEFLDKYAASLDHLIEGVEAAGIPDVEEGEDFVDTVVAGLSQSRDLIVEAGAAVEAGDPDALPPEFEDLTFQDLLTGRQFIDLDFVAGSSELMGLLQDEPACEF